MDDLCVTNGEKERKPQMSKTCGTCGGPATVIDGETVHVDRIGIPIRRDHPAVLETRTPSRIAADRNIVLGAGRKGAK